MPNIPEYQRGTRINPGAPSQGFEESVGNIGKATAQIGEFGYQMARNASIEQATIDGVKAGQTPGRKLLPSFTESDKAFANAYKQEEYATVARNAESYLNKSYFDVAKNPTSEGLSIYQKNANENIEKMTSMISPENRSKLKRDLTSVADSKFYQLAEALDSKDRKEMKLNFNLNVDKDVRDIQTFATTGQTDKAKEKMNESINYIQSQLGSDAVPTQEAADALIENQRRLYDVSSEQGVMQEKIQEGKGAEYLEEWSKKPMTPDNVEIQSALLKQYNFHNSLASTQSSMSANKAMQMAETGTLTQASMMDLKSTMTEYDRSNIDYKVGKIISAQFEKSNQIASIDNNKDDAIFMATQSKESLDSWMDDKISKFTQLNNYEPSLQQQIEIAADARAPIPSLNKKVQNSILNGSPANAVDAMLAYGSSKGQAREALSGIGKEAASQALSFNEFLSAGNDTNDAYLKTKETFKNLSPQENEGLDIKWNQLTKLDGDYDISSGDKLESKVAKSLDYPKGSMPAGLPSIWKKEMAYNFKVSRGNLAIAEQMTNDTFEKAWGVENGKVKYLPPSKFIPNYPLVEPLVQNQLLDGFKDMSAQYKELYDKSPDQQFYYELNSKEVKPENELDYSYKGGPIGITRGGDIHVKKIWRDGTVQKGILEYEADRSSMLPQTGALPNYWVGINIDGTSLPLLNPQNQYNPLRYVPDFSKETLELFKNQNKEKLNQLIKAEKEYPIRKAMKKAPPYSSAPGESRYGY